MRIEILKREKKAKKLEVQTLDMLILNQLRYQHPEIWRQLVNLIVNIDNGEMEKLIKRTESKEKP